MAIPRPRALFAAVTAVGAVAATLIAGPAYAAGALADDAVVRSAVPGTYTFSTTTSYWSVVGLVSGPGDDYDLRLTTNAGALLGSSTLGAGRTDFVAINSNAGRRPMGPYRATAIRFNGAGPYWIEQRQGKNVISLPVPQWNGVTGPSDTDITFSSLADTHVVAVSDIYLVAGQKFWAHSTSSTAHMALLESTNDPATWVRTRTQAINSTDHVVVDNCTLYTAKATGWHALAMFADTPPITPPAQGGYGYALHRYDAAHGNRCPVRNFPASTPAP